MLYEGLPYKMFLRMGACCSAAQQEQPLPFT